MSIWRRVALVSIAALAAPVMAQSGSGWHGIGQAAAADSGSVTIPGTGESRDREIMFCVEGHAMRLNTATLHFQGGGTQDIRVNERIGDGGCSRGKTLSGHNHAVESAVVTYDQAVLAGGSVRVQLFVR
ncbi:MAG: hypothetical protein JO276_07555 [Sphingomonadaceae bacterium]|nr:hypothetical protein [Sphingomonadaceae bacterium]